MSDTVYVKGPANAFQRPVRLVAESERRLVVPVPQEGWLQAFEPQGRGERLMLADAWTVATAREALRRELPPFRRALGLVTFYPKSIAEKGKPGIHVAADLTPTWLVVRRWLALNGVNVHWETLHLGSPVGLPYLLLVLTEVHP